MNSPLVLVTDEDSTAVPCCVAVTVTPGSTPPLASVTRPTIVPVSICAKAEELTVRVAKASRQIRARQRIRTSRKSQYMPSMSSVLLRVLGSYLRSESTLHFPDPIAAKYTNTKQ